MVKDVLFKEEIVKFLFAFRMTFWFVLTMTAATAGAQTPVSQSDSSIGLGQPTPISQPEVSTPEPVPTMTQDQQMQFEDTHLISAETGLFDIRFSLNGQEITSEQDLEKIIASADDDQALKYLKSAENRSSIGWVLIGGGSGMLVVGSLANWNNNNTFLFNFLVLGGLATDLIGGIFYRESQSEKLDAVDRYNQIIREDNGISLLNLPNAPWVWLMSRGFNHNHPAVFLPKVVMTTGSDTKKPTKCH